MLCKNCKKEIKEGSFCSTKCRKEYVNKKHNDFKLCVACGKRIPVKNKNHYCQECLKKQFIRKNYKRIIKLKAVEYKGGKCCICGYDKTISALTFHHLNPKNKDFNISKFSKEKKDMAWEILKKEVDKCILVCNNCHCEINDGLITDEDIKEIIGERKFNKIFNCGNNKRGERKQARRNEMGLNLDGNLLKKISDIVEDILADGWTYIVEKDNDYDVKEHQVVSISLIPPDIKKFSEENPILNFGIALTHPKCVEWKIEGDFLKNVEEIINKKIALYEKYIAKEKDKEK